ncbi:hypothetical protein JHK85_056543 [Glycine max]|nr:hypothetical protein JHK85_056543 [Glycine max]
MIYTCSLQDILPLNLGNIFGAEDTRPIPKWENIIQETPNRPSDDVPDIEEEILLECDNDIGEEVHPLDEEKNICDGTFMGETVNTNLLASDATDIANTEKEMSGTGTFFYKEPLLVFEEKEYLVCVERKNDVQDFGIKESLSELSQLADTACQNEGLMKPWSFSLAGVEKGKLKEESTKMGTTAQVQISSNLFSANEIHTEIQETLDSSASPTISASPVFPNLKANGHIVAKFMLHPNIEHTFCHHGLWNALQCGHYGLYGNLHDYQKAGSRDLMALSEVVRQNVHEEDLKQTEVRVLSPHGLCLYLD